MKITTIEPILIQVPYRHGGPYPRIGGREWRTMDTLLVRVETDQGLTGWGEAFGYNAAPATKAALETAVAPLLIGRTIDVGALMGEMQRSLQNFGRTGPLMFALSGVDIALWDIAGQKAGVPLHRMLGTADKKRVPTYASLLRYGDAALVAHNAAEAAARGYRHVKLHEVGEAEVKAARSAIGADAALMVDTNCPWSLPEALEMAKRFATYNLLWLEEPLWPPEDYAGLAHLARQSGVAIAAGENAATAADFAQMFAVDAVRYAQPSVTKIGGITEMRKIAGMAVAAMVALAPHSPYFGPGLIATLHCIAAWPGEILCERLYCDLEASPFGDAIEAKDGFLAVPQGAGLGVPVDMAVIERYRVR
jgi:L-alanine-DL-glutamate epimerase-like enolase superfamily enzyme